MGENRLLPSRKYPGDLYEGRAFANELARQGLVVLAHDVFLWGSRRFQFEIMPEPIHRLVGNWQRSRKTALKPTEAERYEIGSVGPSGGVPHLDMFWRGRTGLTLRQVEHRRPCSCNKGYRRQFQLIRE